MSEQEQTEQNQDTPQKFTKTKEERAKEKDNTNAWLKKQEEKKKKKLEEQQEQKPVELDEKALEKAKRKEEKRLERERLLKEQGLLNEGETKAEVKVESKETKTESKKEEKRIEEKQPETTQNKKAEKKVAETVTKVEQPNTSQAARKLSKDKIVVQPSIPVPVYTELLSLEHHLRKSFPSISSINKSAQSQLIHKYLDQYVNSNDTVLILSRGDLWRPLSSRCQRRVFLHPHHEEFTKNEQCENIICTYEDVAYLMEGTITKIFVELDMVFANGTGLTQQGNENIIVMANEFKIPVIGFSGTWNFNAWNFLSREMFTNKYGEVQLEKYDIIENEQLEIIVLEIGSVIPKQISGHFENLAKIYRGCDLNSIKW